jgi:serine/threonine protein kinase
MQADALRPGDPKRLGSYELLGRLGDGGQGIVFLGRAEDGTDVAIKLLHRELTADDMARTRFLREIEFAKQVASFCTAQIIDADIEGERPYLVSEYVPGPSVLQLVQAEGPISGGALDRLAIGTATALVAIHQAEVIHRDFKPANVLIGPGGPRVIDFGIARVFDGDNTMTSRVIGTPAFMSPEQMRGREFGKEADIFCWAATMVYAATGRPPFGNDSITAVIQRALNEEPALGDIAEPLRGLVIDCLAKDAADRPSARQLLMRLLGQEDVVAASPHAGEDPSAVLVKIAEATTRLPAGADGDASRTRSLPSGPGGPGARPHADWPAPAADATVPPFLESLFAGVADPAGAAGNDDFRGPDGRHGAEPGPDGPERPVGRGRARAVALTTAAVVAVAVTVGGTAYVMAQSPSGVRHVNNPTSAPATSEAAPPSSAEVVPSTSVLPVTPVPAIQPTVSQSLPRTSSPAPTPSRSSPRPTPTRTRTRTPTPTSPSPTPPDPSTSPQ